jgi:hypothetical protein
MWIWSVQFIISKNVDVGIHGNLSTNLCWSLKLNKF